MTSDTSTTLSKKQLLKSICIAIAISLIVYVTAVLPAEYNIDPLGTGKLLGFSKLYVEHEESTAAPISNVSGHIFNFRKIELEKLGSGPNVPKPVEANDPVPTTQYSQKEDTIRVLVPAGKGVEYKFNALKLGLIHYEWRTDNNAVVYIDFHGEVFQENPPADVFYESYTLAYSNNMAGSFTAPFKGRHGWYFRNDTKEDITVRLRLKGAYELFKK
ncbi:hypothetical protein [Spongiimicrobium salis]|uniref:hypothetical protein n=1 Tax=Spongiimicrobium salis TaxID=1667022 RepID=UPI00374CA79C